MLLCLFSFGSLSTGWTSQEFEFWSARHAKLLTARDTDHERPSPWGGFTSSVSELAVMNRGSQSGGISVDSRSNHVSIRIRFWAVFRSRIEFRWIECESLFLLRRRNTHWIESESTLIRWLSIHHHIWSKWSNENRFLNRYWIEDRNGTVKVEGDSRSIHDSES